MADVFFDDPVAGRVANSQIMSLKNKPDVGRGWRLTTHTVAGGINEPKVQAGGTSFGPESVELSAVMHVIIEDRPLGAEYDWECEVHDLPGGTDDPAWLTARKTDEDNFYAAGFYTSGANPDLRLVKVVGGTATSLGTANVGGAAVGNKFKFEVRNATKKLFRDTGGGFVEEISSTDNAIVDPGRIGVAFGNIGIASGDDVDTWGLKNFKATLVGGAVGLKLKAGIEEVGQVIGQDADLSQASTHHLVEFITTAARNYNLLAANTGERRFIIANKGATFDVTLVRNGTDTINGVAGNFTVAAGKIFMVVSDGTSDWNVFEFK